VRIEREIAKCEIRCANCHRIRTGQRGFFETLILQFELWDPVSTRSVGSGSRKAARGGNRTRERQQRVESIRRRVWQYMLEHACVDCGEDDPRVLDFDHLRDKTMEIGALVRSGYSWKRIAQEITKCEIRCANCHRRRTAKQVGAYRMEMDLAPAAG
jgi:hypothetical protein